jgi:glycosyltransferase involved in cell wall biosynthesis
MFAFFLALWSGRSVCLVSEPYSPRSVGYLDDGRGTTARLRAALRPWLYQAYGLLMRARVRLVFAISPLAVQQFTAIGVPPERIVPFGYFVPEAVAEVGAGGERAHVDTSELAIVFVGSLIERKGLLPLINAVRALRARSVSVRLDVFGAGEPGRYPFDGAAVRYLGTIPFGRSQAVIAGYDVLALPSLHDGWGVVVNEALQAGVPVVCSSEVGAGAMVEKWRCGQVFGHRGGDSLQTVLESLARDRRSLAEMRVNAGALRPILAPDFAAGFMWNALLEPCAPRRRPTCPWYDRDA